MCCGNGSKKGGKKGGKTQTVKTGEITYVKNANLSGSIKIKPPKPS